VSRRADDSGSMLVELLVGMVLMSIIGLVVLDGIVGGFKAQRGLQDRGEALAQIRTAAQRVTRQVREAHPVDWAERTTLTLRRDDTSTTQLRYRWYLQTTGGVTSLMQQTQPTDRNGVALAAYSTGVPVLAGIDGTTLPFAYEPVAQWTAPSGSTTDATTCAMAGTSPVTYDPACIGAVTLDLVRKVPGHTPVTVHARVELRNNG
jgi:type II secretory pathway pseudopilin PulG